MKFPNHPWVTILLALGFLIASVGCAVLAYLWIDRSITLSYVSASHQTTADALSRLSLLLETEWIGMSEEDLLQKLQGANRRSGQEILIKKEGNVIWFDNIRFELEAGRLKKID